MCPNGYPVTDKANWQSGFLPASYQGTYIDTQHRKIEQLIENIRSPQDVFDIQGEPQHVRDLYGDSVHGRQTLIARRLLERDVLV